MITQEKDYKLFLKNIQAGYNPPEVRIRLSQDEPVYTVDWNTRKIDVPTFLSVEADHSAEIVFFKMARYYDGMDLAQMVGVIQFRNAKNEEYYYVIPYYDTTSEDQQLIVPWDISSEVTRYSGTVHFSFKFFKVDALSDEPTVLYEINTLVAKSKVLTGWASAHGNYHNYNAIEPERILGDSTYVQAMQQYINAQNAGLYWTDV